MLDWGPAQRAAYGAKQAVGLGALAGALEAVALATRLKLGLGLAGQFAVGAAAVGANAAFAALIALIIGLPYHVLRREVSTPNAVAGQLGLTGAGLAAWYLWQGAAVLVADGRVPAAALMASMPFAAAVVVYFNARYWLRRTAREEPTPLGFVWVGIGGGLLVAGVAGAVVSSRAPGGESLEGDGNVLLVTVDGLGPDTELKALDRLAARGVRFTEAVTPAVASDVAHGALLTGRHPLRTGLVRQGTKLASRELTLAERLAGEGFATAAFVSGPDLRGRVGLGQGFAVYDDAVAGGFDEVNLLSWTLGGRLATRRAGADTVSAALAWAARYADRPQLVWVHLPAASPGETDAALGALFDGLAAAGLDQGALWVVAGASGPEVPGLANGVAEGRVRVPLVVAWPDGPQQVRVPVAVRLLDVAPTVLGWLGVAEAEEGEGADLRGFADGSRERGLWCALIGTNPAGGPVLGLRVAGVKYVLDLDSGVESLFDLASDPNERRDLAGAQPEALASARAQLGPERTALTRAWGR